MAIPRETDAASPIQLEDEFEGEEIGSRNYRFLKIGEPVPTCSSSSSSSSSSSQFDPKNLPSQPLAVSERFRLLFVAHPKGFYITRTTDVMASANQLKDKQTCKSVEEMCLVDVLVGNVSILALSADDSMLAATVGSYVHFFAVSALLHKDQRPSFSVQLDDSAFIKDLRWFRNAAKVYVILSDRGELSNGSGHGPLSHVMGNVDAVDCSVKGNFVAVARKNILSILSSQLKEKLSFSLPFRSVIGDNDSDVNHVIKVDSVRWIRPDCIAVGCFELNDDDEEQNYIVQVITSKEGRITDAASKVIVLSFNNIFLDFSSDAVPNQNGPHLFLSYLDLYGLAFIANRILSQQVGLLYWSPDSGKNEAAVIEILNDAWVLSIDSQGNGDEVAILGLSVDKASQDENVKLILGDEDTEVSPSCVIICLTIDGKISVFHFASAADTLLSPDDASSEEEDSTSQVSSKHELPHISFGGSKRDEEQIFSKSEVHLLAQNEKAKEAAAKTSVNENVERKSLADSHTMKLGGLTRPLSEISDQNRNEEVQSLPKVKSDTSFLSMKVVGDFSSQSVTWSNGKVDTSETSVARSFSAPFNKVADSNKCTSRPAETVLRESSDINEKAEPSAEFTAFGTRASSGFGNINSLPAYAVSREPSTEGVVPRNSTKSENQDSLLASFRSGLPMSLQNAKNQQFGNVEEMAKKLNILLEGIEGKGGFTDASINSQESLVIELEDTMWTLSNRCQTWSGLMDEKLRDIQHLLDKTVQVLARKVYLEGIFKQDADSRYWELWNCQKLSSELELKRKHVLDLNQELTNQLIELERHFNSLEFNKFGANGALLRDSKASESWRGHLRQNQSLHSLHYTMNAQLQAAEHLSESLSKQMAVLSIESSGKESDAKRKLFESIGLPYNNDTSRSVGRDRSFDTQSNKEQFTISGLVPSKKQFVGHQANSQSYEPETARRHQYSLDRTWATFDPPKTTVKRVLLKDDPEKLTIDKQHLTPQPQKKLETASKFLSTSAVSLNLSRSKGIAEILTEQSNARTATSLLQQKSGLLDCEVASSFAKTNTKSLTESMVIGNNDTGNSLPTDEKLKSNIRLTRKKDSFSGSEPNPVLQSNANVHLGPSMSSQLPDPSLASPSDSIGRLDHSKIGFSKSTTEHLKSTHITTSGLAEVNIAATPTSAFSPVTNVSFAKAYAESSLPSNEVSTTTSVPLSSPSRHILSSVSSSQSKTITPSLFPLTLSSPEASGVAKQEVSQLQTSVPSNTMFISTMPLSSGSGLSLTSLASPSLKSESEKSFSSSAIDMYGSKTEGSFQTQTPLINEASAAEKDSEIQSSPSQPILSTSVSGLKLVPSASSNLTKSMSGFNGSSNNSSVVASIIQSEKPETLSPIATSSAGIVGIVKNVVTDASQEEEMEEEAPEPDQTTEVALGSLSGFGIGSIPNTSPGKPNPFGAVSLNRDMSLVASPFTMSASSSGLFQPASFNFHPLQPSESVHPAAGNFSSAFSSGTPSQISSVSGFGQPAHIGSGQQALGSVLGTFGQSRQLGVGITGNSVGASGFGSGFMVNAATAASVGGFASASTHGGFASASTHGGFAGLAAGAGGFASAATNGGFAAAASAGGGFSFPATGSSFSGGFGAFSSQQGGPSAFGGASGTGRPPSEFFTQMRK